jgi:hypothetical protein
MDLKMWRAGSGRTWRMSSERGEELRIILYFPVGPLNRQ